VRPIIQNLFFASALLTTACSSSKGIDEDGDGITIAAGDCDDNDAAKNCHTVQFTNGDYRYDYSSASGSGCGTSNQGTSCSFTGWAAGTIDTGNTTCSFSFGFAAGCNSPAKNSYTAVTSLNIGNGTIDSSCGYTTQDIGEFDKFRISASFSPFGSTRSYIEKNGSQYMWIGGTEDGDQDTIVDFDCYYTYENSSIETDFYGDFEVYPSAVIPLD